ncbi:hypothetical protein [Leptospira wolffii]|uniref:hypothetical protein n=1 Tax=Leptospira wolffii TaxID=409998 RepID=UPI0002EE6D04|nr:hypothetical protein [Leptospira wolffii]EPG68279.1 hypothetical protein LEP1GSC061_0090 [Leptospira wolffii serovar Khorat str. Khorat-H2]
MIDLNSILNNLLSNFIWALLLVIGGPVLYIIRKGFQKKNDANANIEKEINVEYAETDLQQEYSSIHFSVSELELARLNSLNSSKVKTADPLILEGKREVFITDSKTNKIEKMQTERIEIKSNLPPDRYFSLYVDSKRYFDVSPRFSIVEINNIQDYMKIENSAQLFPVKIQLIWYASALRFSFTIGFDEKNLFPIEDCISANEFLLAFYTGKILTLKEKDSSNEIPFNIEEARKELSEKVANNITYIKKNLASFQIIQSLRKNLFKKIHGFRPSLSEYEQDICEKLSSYYDNSGFRRKTLKLSYQLERKNLILLLKPNLFRRNIGELLLKPEKSIKNIPFLEGTIRLEGQSIHSSKNKINNKVLLIFLLLIMPFKKAFKVNINSISDSLVVEKFEMISYMN